MKLTIELIRGAGLSLRTILLHPYRESEVSNDFPTDGIRDEMLVLGIPPLPDLHPTLTAALRPFGHQAGSPD